MFQSIFGHLVPLYRQLKIVAFSPFSKTNFWFGNWQPTDQDSIAEDEPKFKPFTGSGKRLDGKGPKQQAPEVSSAAVPARSAPSPSESNKRASQQTAAPSGATTSTRQKTGKLVFGSSASNKKEAQKVVCNNTMVFSAVHIPPLSTESVLWRVKTFKFSVFQDK
jgi:hypothetical protein